MLNQQKSGVIARAVRPYYCDLSLSQLGMSEISGGVKVAAEPLKTACASELAAMSCADASACVAELRGHERIDLLNEYSFSCCLVLDEALQLGVAPVAYPVIHDFSSPVFSYAFEVFQDYLVPVEFGNNLFADVVVNPAHEPLLTSSDFSKESLGAFCAFTLKNGTQVFESSFSLLDVTGGEEPTVGSDGKVVYSEVNAQNTLRSVVPDFDLFGKCEEKKAASLFVNSEKTFVWLQSEILEITLGNFQVEFMDGFQEANAQLTIQNSSTSRKIVADTSSFNYGLGLGFFYDATSLTNASDGKLTCQTKFSQLRINKFMQFDIISNVSIPCLINTKLEGNLVDLESFKNIGVACNLDFSSHNASHERKYEDEYLNFMITTPLREQNSMTSFLAPVRMGALKGLLAVLQ